jgi:hypothetical protein
MTNFASAEESAVSRKYDKEIAAAEGNSKKQKKLEEKKQKEINAIRAKYADMQFAVTVAQTISSTALAAMEAYKAMAGIPVVGPALGAAAAAAAIAYGASQIAVAKEQRDAGNTGTRYDESYDRFVDVMERLDIPFTGIVRYKGDDGIEAAENLDEKMMKNASR